LVVGLSVLEDLLLLSKRRSAVHTKHAMLFMSNPGASTTIHMVKSRSRKLQVQPIKHQMER
ncbi:hypothetical protein, partial [Salmonella sp. s51228]|uniref:hypothetical protein n=1 Tax=Salmonella sp. s51228 TaxID=3159652 RepID=UPI00398009C8